jgi:branched-chain amino acid transport system permease protein
MKILIIQLMLNGFIAASFYALCGVSWGVIYRTTRIFHFAHHLVFAVAGYTAFMIASQAHLPYFLGLLAAVAVAAFLGCCTDAFLYRPLRKMGATRETTFLASLGFATAGVAILLFAFSSTPRRVEGFPAKILSLGEAFFSVADLTLVIGCWVMIILLLLFLKKSKYGKAIRAVGSNVEMARNVGLNIDRIYLLVFAIGSVLFGVGAFLFSVKNVVFPTMGMLPLFMAFSAVFLGGVNSIPGHALAGMLLGFSESLGMLVLPGQYRTMIAFSVLFVVIIIRPKGLISFVQG